MPKYDIILIKRKIKTIRASSKEVAQQRAEAIVNDSDWMLESIENSAMGIEITE
jgi:hypothetical protein